MSKIGIFFGSSTGTTEEVAQQIAKKIGVDNTDIHDVANASAEDMLNYDLLLLGSSTWGSGDLQDDWEDFLPKTAELNLSGKKIAFFGCGDSSNNSDTFCNSLATIKEEIRKTGAQFIGKTSPEGYNYDETRCLEEDKLIGLLLDEVNESDMTEDRMDKWVAAVKSEM